ncbi:MAG: U32 family peptidase [Tannerella sp.]|jgi:putative protease|nr:U32 family peptidase [Tannerella sp.]
MIAARPVELLAPAKDLACGIEAIRHGADAVYIGAPKFSARAAAGNTVDDIRRLCDYAHLFNVHIYVALNTILRDDELPEAGQMIRELYRAGIDALIIQDMGITQLDLPPVPLHVSTQADNCTPEQIAFFHQTGFAQVVLARELSLSEIQTVSEQTPIRLEAFVHGALCVSYSGRCYLSEALSKRSANRGACAQYCRLPYSLIDATGQTMVADKHLLSLKDLNRAEYLEAMMQAGVTSFKIEGRLKDVSYVKNITSFYRQKLDAVFIRNPHYFRSSVGRSSLTFRPQADKSFNRGFTSYMLHGRIPEITAFDSPKSIGEPVGRVKEVKGNSFTLTGLRPVHHGDGLVFINGKGTLEGFRVNRVEANRIFPHRMPFIRPETFLYRNFDKDFEEELSKVSAERKLSVNMVFADTPVGFSLSVTDETEARIILSKPFQKELAHNDSADHIRRQLSRLGNTSFVAGEILINFSALWFVPSSLLSGMRREAIEKLEQVHRIRYRRSWVKKDVYNRDIPYPKKHLDYTANVANQQAIRFYKRHGVDTVEPAFELKQRAGVPLMYAKHCLRYSLGWCPVHHRQKSPYKDPFYLVHKQTKLRLSFDCKTCQMLVYNENKSCD